MRSCSQAPAASAMCCARAELDLSIGSFLVSVIVFGPRKKKAGVVEHPEVFDHAGLLINGPPGKAGVPFI
jgi:hypothetical protein